MNSTHASNKNSVSEFAIGAKRETVPACPACSCTKGFTVKMARVYECADCHAIYGEMYLGDSYSYVLPYWAGNDALPENQRYFDFTCLGSKGVERRHGWFDTISKRITQVG